MCKIQPPKNRAFGQSCRRMHGLECTSFCQQEMKPTVLLLYAFLQVSLGFKFSWDGIINYFAAPKKDANPIQKALSAVAGKIFFNQNEKDFSKTSHMDQLHAADALIFAMEAYKHPKQRTSLQPKHACATFTKVDSGLNTKHDISYVIYESDKYTGTFVLAFRGSTSEKNWDLNNKFITADCVLGKGNGCGRIHEGFQTGYQSVREELKPKLQKLPIRRLIITGHSLGGALSVIASYDLKMNDFPVTHLFTFGAPRVGNKEFEEHISGLKLHEMRVQLGKDNARDYITTVPPVVAGYVDASNSLYAVICREKKCEPSLMHGYDAYVRGIDYSLTQFTQKHCSDI